MPGILTSKGCMWIETEGVVRAAIIECAEAWSSEKARAYRERNGIADEYDLPLIVQDLVRAQTSDYERKRKFYPYEKFFGAGVFNTHDPNTGEYIMFGRYVENSSGDALMTGGNRGVDINDLAELEPEIYEQLMAAREKLYRKTKYPQEVEFVIEKGSVYFLQTRAIQFSPQAEIAYIKGQITRGEISEARAIPALEKLSARLSGRMMFKVREGADLDVITTGMDSTPGALQGTATFRVERAKELSALGEAVILIATEDNREEVIREMFNLKEVGLIVLYGSGSSHEAVLTRGAGVPSIINIDREDEVDERSVQISGDVYIREGDNIGIDGARKIVFTAAGNVLEEDSIMKDASYGVDIEQRKAEVFAQYLEEGGEFKSDVTYDQLVEENARAFVAWEEHEKLGDKENSFKANLDKHFLHQLLLMKGKEECICRKGIESDVDSVIERQGAEVNRDREESEFVGEDASSVIRFIKRVLSLIGLSLVFTILSGAFTFASASTGDFVASIYNKFDSPVYGGIVLLLFALASWGISSLWKLARRSIRSRKKLKERKQEKEELRKGSSDSERMIRGDIDNIGAIGSKPSKPEKGRTRLGYTKQEDEAFSYVESRMNAIGMETRYDAAGNLYGRVEGTDPDAKIIRIISHLDSVVSAGKYDGVTGVVAGIEIVRRLMQGEAKITNPIEVVAYRCEESTRFSRALIGSGFAVGNKIPERDIKGRKLDIREKLAAAMKQRGLDFDKAEKEVDDIDNIEFVLEIHPQQSAGLASSGIDIGLVEGIASPVRFVYSVDIFEEEPVSRDTLKYITFTGQQDHSGATPMHERKDSLVAAANFSVSLSEKLGRRSFVAGINIVSAAMNTIPGDVSIALNIREDEEKLFDAFIASAKEENNNVEISISDAKSVSKARISCFNTLIFAFSFHS